MLFNERILFTSIIKSYKILCNSHILKYESIFNPNFKIFHFYIVYTYNSHLYVDWSPMHLCMDTCVVVHPPWSQSHHQLDITFLISNV
jgi:hypothetical protein